MLANIANYVEETDAARDIVVKTLEKIMDTLEKMDDKVLQSFALFTLIFLLSSVTRVNRVMTWDIQYVTRDIKLLEEMVDLL